MEKALTVNTFFIFQSLFEYCEKQSTHQCQNYRTLVHNDYPNKTRVVDTRAESVSAILRAEHRTWPLIFFKRIILLCLLCRVAEAEARVTQCNNIIKTPASGLKPNY